jgi:hypothetical protein
VHRHHTKEKDMTATNQPTPPETPRENDELTLAEVADLVHVPLATLRYWRAASAPAHKLPDREHRPLRRRDAAQWPEAQSRRTPSGSEGS